MSSKGLPSHTIAKTRPGHKVGWVVISSQVPPAVVSRLARLAAKRKRSRSALIYDAVLAHLEREAA